MIRASFSRIIEAKQGQRYRAAQRTAAGLCALTLSLAFNTVNAFTHNLIHKILQGRRLGYPSI